MLIESAVVAIVGVFLFGVSYRFDVEHRRRAFILAGAFSILWLVHEFASHAVDDTHTADELSTFGMSVVMWIVATWLVLKPRSDERALAYQRYMLAGIINGTDGVIFAKDSDGRYIVANSEIENAFGSPGESVIGKTDFDIFPRDFAERLRADDESVASTGTTIQLMERVPQNGIVRVFQTTKFPIRDARGKIIAVGGIGTDVTTLENTRKELHEAMTFLDGVLEHIPASVFVKRASDLTFVRVNRNAEELFGFRRNDLIGKGDADFVAPEEAVLSNEKDREILYGLKFLDIPQEMITTPHLGKRFVHTKKIALHDAGGNPEYLLSIADDITRQVENHNELLALTNRLEQRVDERTRELQSANEGLVEEIAARRRSELKLEQDANALERSNEELFHFVYAASHDLKSPLLAIRNLAQWISEDNTDRLSPESQRHLVKLRQRVTRIERLVQDLLQYSTVTTTTYEPEAVDIRDIIDRVVEKVSPTRPLDIEVGIDAASIRTYEDLLERCVYHLVENAVRHGSERGGNIAVRVLERGECIELIVKDDGPGIALEDQGRIFEMFQKLENRDEVEGSGIGLAYVKKTADHVGGRVWVVSELGLGCEFHLLWPRMHTSRLERATTPALTVPHPSPSSTSQ
ncbi:MAG: PAS domain-containing protein [Deltaproteobacteria bacterium]|nr:PAS domain-containing protein [Deltaproteobacteria bacterium]